LNQKKIGCFLKELRKEKGLTQEELAEKLNVSGRTISRWETGANMPDISLLVEISAFFDVSIPEIINGERAGETMREEVRDVADKLSEYANAEKETMIRHIRVHSIIGTAALVVCGVLELSGAAAKSEVLGSIFSYCEAMAFVTILMNMLHTSGLIYKLKNRQRSPLFSGLPKALQLIIAAITAYAIASIMKLIFQVLGL